MEGGMLTLLILAAATVFLFIKLMNVLGTKTGHEKPAPRRFEAPSALKPSPAEAVEDSKIENGPVARAIAEMRAAEPDFSSQAFVSGARSAYEMLLMAFENGDKETLEKYLSPNVFQEFAQAIDDRAAKGLTVDARFVGLREAEIVDARFDVKDGMAEIDMRFVGELVTVVRDSEHRIVEGDPNEIRRERDTWTFGRKMGASDPNWLLIATGA